MHFIGSAPLESLSLWERWHCEAMTERASPARKSRCAAMGRLFVSAKRALHLCFSPPAALPSQALRASSPKGRALGISQSFISSPEAPLQGATTTTAASGGSRESLLGQRPARRKRSAADAGCRNPALSANARLRGWTKDSLAESPNPDTNPTPAPASRRTGRQLRPPCRSPRRRGSKSQARRGRLWPVPSGRRPVPKARLPPAR